MHNYNKQTNLKLDLFIHCIKLRLTTQQFHEIPAESEQQTSRLCRDLL